MILSAIAAVSLNNVIGKDNRLPWKIPADLRYFKNQTWGMPLIMGRKTFESVNCPLPGRTSIVVTRNAGWNRGGVLVASTISEAIRIAGNLQTREIFITGGAEIFGQSMDMLDRMYITRIQAVFDGDAFFPDIPSLSWKLTREDPYPADEKNPYPYVFEVWEKLKSGVSIPCQD